MGAWLCCPEAENPKPAGPVRGSVGDAERAVADAVTAAAEGEEEEEEEEEEERR